jgi:hypothetical protein
MRIPLLAVAVLALTVVSCDVPDQQPRRTRNTTAPVTQEAVTGTATACVVSPRETPTGNVAPGC